MMRNIFGYDFLHPWVFLLLLLLPLFAWLHFFKKKEGAFSLGLPLVAADWTFQKNWKFWLMKFLPIITGIAYFFTIVALARPIEKFQKERISSEGIDIMTAFDISYSMKALDFEPDRLTAARELLGVFIEERKSDRIGLSVFSGEAYTISPPTMDHNVLQEFARGLDHNPQLKNGTAIGLGLATCISRLKDSDSKSKIIILITDGSNYAGSVDPLEAADMAKSIGIKVYTIGVGSDKKYVKIPVKVGRRIKYRYEEMALDETLLKEIADKTDGKYFRAKSSNELQEVYDEINKLEKVEIDAVTITRKEERFHYFLLWGLAFFVLSFVCRTTILRNIDL